MNRMITWFVHNPVAANLLMALLVLGGLTTLPRIFLEEFPTTATGTVQIQVEYRGAEPE